MNRWLALLVLAEFVSIGGLTRGHENEFPQTIPFSLIDNRVFVEVKLNVRGPFAFLLDTGSSGETVNARLAAALHLPRTGKSSTDGAGEKKAAYATVHLAALRLGGTEFGAMDVPALDTATLERAIGFTRFDGVLGTDLFQRAVVTFDFVHSRLLLQNPAKFKADPRIFSLPMDLNNDLIPVVTAKVNGIEGRFLIDTGDRSSLTLFGPFWRAHHLDREVGPTVTAMTGYGIGGSIRGIVGRPLHFSLGGLDLPPPVTRLSLQKAGVFTSADYAGSIGMGVLKRFTCTFDYLHHRLYLQGSAQFDEEDLYDRAGLWLGLDEAGQVVVMDVTEGGPAARVGVQVGDEISEADDLPGNAEHLFALREMLRQPVNKKIAFYLKRRGTSLTCTVHLIDLIAPAPTGLNFSGSSAPAVR